MRCYYLLRELSRYAEVDVVTLNQKKLLGQYFESAEEGEVEARDHLSVFVNSLEIAPLNFGKTKTEQYLLAVLSLFSKIPYSVKWFSSQDMRNYLEKSVTKKKYDIIHFDTIGLAQYLDVFSETASLFTLDHHNVESHMMLRRAKKTSNLLKKFYFWQEGKKIQKYEKKFFKNFSLHITCSDLDANRLREISPAIVARTVANPVELPKLSFERIIDRDNPRLLFIGGLDWYPNLDAITHFFKEIFPIVRRRIPNVRVDIVGKNPPEFLRKLGQQDSCVQVHGFVESIEPFYKHSSIYICPIRDGGGTKLKVVDAFALAQAVVGYPEAFEGLDVESGKNCYIADTPEDFAELIVNKITDVEELEMIGLSGRAVVQEHYEAGVVGKKMFQSYLALANNKL